ncbi:hypothetical protein FYC62_08540 [Pedobacter aquae]|uniref:DUF5723 domain-containing protein n=1 Tax=Pedobacter aquae TaxID=2605747 RepID=A0A5C0VJ27_9SPHI|nr:DUF5723 family protein [Pedobacter aquae]QEK51701.1 hypothetical protein FYC62_08540 [Pedobacter aquae]
MRIWVFLSFLVFAHLVVKAQETSLIHSKTVFDSFENPVNTAFVPEVSNKYAVSFLLSSFSTQLRFKGDIEPSLKAFIFNRDSIKGGPLLGANKQNELTGNVNYYLAMFKLFKSIKYQREIGASIQFRNIGNALVPNSTFAFLDSYKNFNSPYADVFNSTALNQSFWQFGLTYRENYNEKLAFGAKLSFLSGATYHQIDIKESAIRLLTKGYEAYFNGSYQSNLGTDSVEIKNLLPNFKNPGMAITLGSSYAFKNGMYVTAHLKDLGFIRWNKNAVSSTFSDTLTPTKIDTLIPNGNIRTNLNRMIATGAHLGKFTSFLPAHLQIAASKEFGLYKPVFVATQYFDGRGTQLALVNNFRTGAFNFALNAQYDKPNGLQFGGLVMLQSLTTELYLGSEKLLPSYYFTKGMLNKDANIGRSPTQMNIFMGLNIKFGRKVQSDGMADFIDGLNDAETGFVYRLSNKERKAVRKEAAKNTKKANKRRN